MLFVEMMPKEEVKNDHEVKPSFLEVYCELSFFIKECSGAPNSFIASIRVTIEDIQDPAKIMEVIERYKNVLEQIKKSYIKEKG